MKYTPAPPTPTTTIAHEVATTNQLKEERRSIGYTYDGGSGGTCRGRLVNEGKHGAARKIIEGLVDKYGVGVDIKAGESW